MAQETSSTLPDISLLLTFIGYLKIVIISIDLFVEHKTLSL